MLHPQGELRTMQQKPRRHHRQRGKATPIQLDERMNILIGYALGVLISLTVVLPLLRRFWP